MIEVKVLLFAVLRDRLGKSDFGVILSEGATLKDLVEKIFPNSEDRSVKLKAVTYAINYESADLDVPLHNGDEVALLPPMSGG